MARSIRRPSYRTEVGVDDCDLGQPALSLKPSVADAGARGGQSFEHPGRCIDADPFARYARDDQRDVPPVRRR